MIQKRKEETKSMPGNTCKHALLVLYNGFGKQEMNIPPDCIFLTGSKYCNYIADLLA